MRKLAYCLTLVSCLMMGASAFAQVDRPNGTPPPPPQGNPFETAPAPSAPPTIAPVNPGYAPNAGPGYAPGYTPNQGPGYAPNSGSGYIANGGYVAPGCGANGQMMGGCDGGACGGACGGGLITSGRGCDGGACGGGLITSGRGCDGGACGGRACGGRCGNKFLGGKRCVSHGDFGGLCSLFGSGKRHPKYLSLDIGWSAMDSAADNLSFGQIFPPPIPMEDALVGRIGVGQYVGNWRMEGEVGYRKHKVDDIVLFNQNYFHADGDRRTTTFMTNFFYDVNSRGRIRPYAKCGVGTSYNETDGSRFVNPVGSQAFVGDVFPGADSWEFAWSVGGGLGICLTRCLILDLEYQYIELGGTATGFNSMGSSLGLGKGWAHELTMGFRVNF